MSDDCSTDNLAALHNYLWRLLTPEQRIRLPRGVSGQSFFESVRICKRRLLWGLVLHPDDAMCFNIWNDHLKVQWEGILDAINARKKQYGVERHATADLDTTITDYDSFIRSLELTDSQRVLLDSARADVLSYM
ncbi:uncharacterized protein ARMOST_04777 [Armillaria ostoyae]|uniref:Uncharacterized protein n=1 Tax=Armillaria ostoyae TaxID=47428 RepID=A0A284QYG1_ARMOS|nr:uncharacterized protein ARMOST_04777 [Armillaria ostoyae]